MGSPFTETGDPEKSVKVTWLGHAMFLLEGPGGIRVVTDPYDEQVGYRLPDVTADVVLVSHDHFDHSNVKLVKGDPEVVRGTGAGKVKGLEIEGFPSYHDDKKGRERGGNIIFRWKMAGITFVHLGDLGHLLDRETAARLAGPDVLFIPVGGTFTIDDARAEETTRSLSPRIAVPMHFKNDACGFPIKSAEPYLSRFDNVERVGASTIYLTEGELPPPTLVLLLDYAS